MNSLELEFFEEYKKVDAICKDMYSTEQGVGSYLENMDETPCSIRYKIKEWSDDYRKLKHMRWLRNKIAHENSFVGCTSGDLDWIKNFHARLINRQDPLAVAYKLKKKTNEMNTSITSNSNCRITTHTNNHSIEFKTIIFWVVFAIIIALIIIAITGVAISHFIPFYL